MAVSSAIPVALAALLLFAGADAFSTLGARVARPAMRLDQHVGAGGMADTRDPDAYADEDPRKSISAAPSFEEYLKSRATETGGAAPAAAPVAAVSTPVVESAAAASVGSGDVDAASAIATLEASQTKMVADIAAAIPDLAVKPDASISGDFSIGGGAVKLDASDAPGPANVAWLSDLCVDGLLSSLTIYNGPLTDVPHLISRCAVKDGEVKFFLDFRPRAYGAYDLTDAERSPDALGRKSFEYSGARKDFDTKFGTEEVLAFFEGIRNKLEGATDNPGLGDDSLPEAEKVTRGPMCIDVTMPLSAGNIGTIQSAREKATSLWLSWATDDSHAHRPGAPINSQYVYDSKYKINAYGALLDVYVDMFGQSDGERLAAADSGPIDDAYVGGGS
ncbi:hypothetical protein ACHAXT_013158 [Thalassiosira profunda]